MRIRDAREYGTHLIGRRIGTDLIKIEIALFAFGLLLSSARDYFEVAYSIQLEQRLARNRILMTLHYGVRYNGESSGKWKQKKYFHWTLLFKFSTASITYRVKGRQWDSIRTSSCVLETRAKSLFHNSFPKKYTPFSMFYIVLYEVIKCLEFIYIKYFFQKRPKKYIELF